MKSKRIINLFCIFSILLGPIVSGVSAADYEYEVKAKKMTFAWKIDGDMLAAKISAKTKGWVGIGFNPSEKMKGADFVITGEGRIDFQSVMGKTPVGVSRMAAKQNIPVVAIAGAVTDDSGVVHDHGINSLFSILEPH